MARRRKRRGGFIRFLWKRRVLFIFLVILGAIGWASSAAIDWYRGYTQRIIEMQEALEKADMNNDPGRFIALQRSLEFQRLEPAFWALAILMLASLTTVLIIAIYKSQSDSRHQHVSSDRWLPEMRAKRERARQRE